MEMPFGTFDYLGDLMKFQKIHRASPIVRGPTRGRITHMLLLLSFCLELVYRSESARGHFSRPKGEVPLLHVPFCGFCANNSYF